MDGLAKEPMVAGPHHQQGGWTALARRPGKLAVLASVLAGLVLVALTQDHLRPEVFEIGLRVRGDGQARLSSGNQRGATWETSAGGVSDASHDPRDRHRDEHVGWQNFPAFKRYVESQPDSITCKGVILDLAQKLQDELVRLKANVPLFIGGIGDSGTRSLVDFLGAFNVSFGRTTYSRDSVAFMDYYDLDACHEGSSGETLSTKAGDIYTTILAEHGVYGLRYDASVRVQSTWFTGLQITLRILLAQVSYSEEDALMLALKQPRSTLFLPLLHKLFGDQLRYVHLLRDPRDLAGGTFSKFYNDVCKIFYTDVIDLEQCDGGTRNRLEFDARYDMEAVRWLQTNLGREQFLIVRIEDLVNDGNVECLDLMLDFLQRDCPALRRPQERVREQAAVFASHSGSFCGRKFSPEERIEMNKGSLRRGKVTFALRLLGYDVPDPKRLDAQWGTDGRCGQEMPALRSPETAFYG